MSYILNGSPIRRPNRMQEDNSTQFAANRTLAGTNTRDYFGANKRVWMLEYDNINPTDFTTIQALYQAYLASEVALSWQVTEGNYPVNLTSVLVDLQTRRFTIPGGTYLQATTLILTEA